MKLGDYVGKVVKVDLDNGFFYRGKVISADDDSLEMIDKTGKRVVIFKRFINYLAEVE